MHRRRLLAASLSLLVLLPAAVLLLMPLAFLTIHTAYAVGFFAEAMRLLLRPGRVRATTHPAIGTTASASDLMNDPQRFYRVVLLP